MFFSPIGRKHLLHTQNPGFKLILIWVVHGMEAMTVTLTVSIFAAPKPITYDRIGLFSIFYRTVVLCHLYTLSSFVFFVLIFLCMCIVSPKR